jgi:hypothetical protein
MNFRETTEAVLELTVRPDKEALAQQKVNAVIRTISLSVNAWQDLTEEVLSDHPDWVAANNVQSLALPERFRKIDYIQRDLAGINSGVPAGAVAGGVLNSRHSHGLRYNLVRPNVIKKEGRLLVNTYYLSGVSLLVNQQIAGESTLWGYYTYPVRMTAPADTNWVLQLMPDLVIDWASQFVLQSLGDLERARGVGDLAGTQLSVFIDEIQRRTNTSVETGR